MRRDEESAMQDKMVGMKAERERKENSSSNPVRSFLSKNDFSLKLDTGKKCQMKWNSYRA